MPPGAKMLWPLILLVGVGKLYSTWQRITITDADLEERRYWNIERCTEIHDKMKQARLTWLTLGEEQSQTGVRVRAMGHFAPKQAKKQVALSNCTTISKVAIHVGADQNF